MKKLSFLFAFIFVCSMVFGSYYGKTFSAESVTNNYVWKYTQDNLHPENYVRFELYHIVIGEGASSYASVSSEYQYQRYFSTEVKGEDGKRKTLGSYYDSRYINTVTVGARGGANGYAKAWVTW